MSSEFNKLLESLRVGKKLHESEVSSNPEVGKYLATGFGPDGTNSKIYYKIISINDKGDCTVDDGLVFDEHGHFEGRHGGRGMILRKSLIDDGSFLVTDPPYNSKS